MKENDSFFFSLEKQRQTKKTIHTLIIKSFFEATTFGGKLKGCEVLEWMIHERHGGKTKN